MVHDVYCGLGSSHVLSCCHTLCGKPTSSDSSVNTVYLPVIWVIQNCQHFHEGTRRGGEGRGGEGRGGEGRGECRGGDGRGGKEGGHEQM